MKWGKRRQEEMREKRGEEEMWGRGGNGEGEEKRVDERKGKEGRGEEETGRRDEEEDLLLERIFHIYKEMVGRRERMKRGEEEEIGERRGEGRRRE